MRLVKNNFLVYKFLNSSFTGLSIGILFTIYEPLSPIVYSAGGMVLAGLMILVALFYEKLLNATSFFVITMVVEFVMLAVIYGFFILGYGLTSALLVYCGYQLTFVFGGYLVRAETLVANDKDLLSKIDVLKQVGYLVGLGLSFLYYLGVEKYFEIDNPKMQVILLHYVLMVLQSLVFMLALYSFKKDADGAQA